MVQSNINIPPWLKDYLKEVVDVSILLDVLGFKVRHKGPKELRCSCIIHGGDNPTAFRMRRDTKTFSCYSHRCELTDNRTDNDVISLVMKVKKINFIEAIYFLADLCGINMEEISTYEDVATGISRQRDVRSHISRIEKIIESRQKLPEISEELIKETIKSRSDYFTLQGISEDVQNFFEIGFMYDDRGIPRATIPIRDADGRAVGLSGRRTDNNEEPRYLLMKDFMKRRVFYNLNNAISVREAFHNNLVVVEGFKTVWHLHSCGFPNTVACMGVRITSEQMQVAGERGFTNCIIMFDGDPAGRDGTQASIEVARMYMRVTAISLYDLFPGKSPDDLDKDTVIDILKYAVEI